MGLALSSPPSQNRLCQHPLSLAVQKDDHFRGLFNLSTPVLLWDGLFTQELWENLSQHKVPYGWQGLPRKGNLLPVASPLPPASAKPLLPTVGPTVYHPRLPSQYHWKDLWALLCSTPAFSSPPSSKQPGLS